MFPIDFFWRAAAMWPQRTAIDSPEGLTSYAGLAADVAALAAGLRRFDPLAGSRVAICARNSREHIVALLAVAASGKVWLPLNNKSTAHEIARIVQATEPTILIADRASAPLLQGATAHTIWTGLGGPTDETLEGVVAQHAGAQPIDLAAMGLTLSDTQAIKFTGGTTGLPKGVMQPYRAWLANIANQIHWWSLDVDDRYVLAAPVTHGTGTYVLPVLAQGGCHLVLAESGPQAVRAAFRDRGGTLCFMPPTLVYMLMSLPDTTRSDYPRLRRLIYGGAPMPPEKIRQVRTFFGPVLGTTYGQTEAPQILTALRPADFNDERNWASVGQRTWFSDVEIMAPDGRILGPGEVGEVVARGDLVMSGYWRLPDKTAETLVDGWLHTGDRGLFDERGYLYLRDRLKELVITGGFNVYPSDVENALGQHPAVHECAVFGVPHDKWGEAVQAAVQLRSGANATEAELIAFVRERLGPVQTPKHIHFFEDLPRSPVGKVLKTDVRQQAMNRGEAS